jgi:hypothetical protein
VFTVDAALQHTCAIFREQADRGEITSTECDLLTDGAILLAMHLEEQIQNTRAGLAPAWPEAAQPLPARRRGRHRPAAA